VRSQSPAATVLGKPSVHSDQAPPIAISVVCPFFNEEVILEAALERMLRNLDQQIQLPWELILVDDGSRDQSISRLRASLPADESRVRVLSLPLNQGRGRALKVGIDAACGDIIVTTEIDCSWGDDIVQRLADVLRTEPEVDFAIASPHVPAGGHVNVPSLRVFLSKAGNRLIRWFFGWKVTMSTGMTRAYRRGLVTPLIVHEKGKEFHLEVLLKLLTRGFKVREIPATITWEEHKLTRAGSARRKSSTNIFKTIRAHLRFIILARPMRCCAWLMALTLLGGAGVVAVALLLRAH
jgi:glycosyltransferase involved in cell wall biosynthesis